MNRVGCHCCCPCPARLLRVLLDCLVIIRLWVLLSHPPRLCAVAPCQESCTAAVAAVQGMARRLHLEASVRHSTRVPPTTQQEHNKRIGSVQWAYEPRRQ